MKKENLFFLLILITILITRISIIIIPEVNITLFNIIIHHFWFGVILMLIGLFIPKKLFIFKIGIYGIGAGLIIDQLIFMILGAGQDKEYWAFPSLIGMIIMTFIVFELRKKNRIFVASAWSVIQGED